MEKKMSRVEFKMNRQSKPKMTDEQIRVLKEVGSDAELLGEFLAKLSWFIRRTTNANTFVAEVELDDTVIQHDIIRAKLSYQSFEDIGKGKLKRKE